MTTSRSAEVTFQADRAIEVKIPMTAFNITDYRAGDSLIIAVTVKDALRQIVDLTGATARWGVARKKLDGTMETALVTKSVGSGIVLTDADAGVLTITLGEEDFTSVGEFAHELEIVLADGTSYTPMTGRFVSKATIYPEAA